MTLFQRAPTSDADDAYGKVTSIRKNLRKAEELGDVESAEVLRDVESRLRTRWTEMSRFQQLCDRYDNLYYPNVLTKGGADHWPEDPNRSVPGKAHISLNAYPVYVDVPASLQAVEPVENIVPAEDTEESRNMAAGVERLYMAWKRDVDFERKAHQACVVKGLYGRTAAKVWWDDDKDMPTVRVVDQPRNLWMGWADTDYTRLDWAAYIYRISATGAMEQFGVDCDRDEHGWTYVTPQRSISANGTQTTRGWLTEQDWGMVEVVDYWCRHKDPDATVVLGEPTKMVTRNVIIVGNVVVKDETHEEYEGQLPYVPLFNTFVPGLPDGRSELYDVEQLIRQKEESLSAGATMVNKTVGAQFWQLVGPEAPDTTPVGLRPKPNEVVAPGPGSRIEAIEPWMPEFQLEQYLSRLDREMVDVTGLNDLLRGLAPASVMSSSKAITALVANYEARIRMRRDLFYEWRVRVWDLSAKLWSHETHGLEPILKMAGRLEVINPSLTPRDDIETATMAANLLNSKIWSQTRAMDMTGVEDPEAEQQRIREERTDATLFAADVQTIAATLATLQQLQTSVEQVQQMAMQGQGGMGAGQMSPGAVQQAYAQQSAGLQGSPMMNGQGEGMMLPPEAMPMNAGEGAQGFPGQLGGPGGGPGLLQTQFKEGEASSRVLTQQPLGEEPLPGEAGAPM